ncbi:hypothetical protein GBA52_010142 [Prunus armeniaca]|nr:hypothetical protein GBA52_010142 [Prunus armeniaca]
MAEVDAHTQEEFFDVLTKTGQKTGISKPRQAKTQTSSFSFPSDYPDFTNTPLYRRIKKARKFV